MVKTKKTLGKVACIFGNMPTDLLTVGTVEQVKDYAKKLIDTCAPGGGYIMANGAFFDKVKAENVKAMVDYAKEHGAYK
jgi:uroporphyrinogen-III decarboxylase